VAEKIYGAQKGITPDAAIVWIRERCVAELEGYDTRLTQIIADRKAMKYAEWRSKRALSRAT